MDNYYTLEEILSPDCVNDAHYSRQCRLVLRDNLG
jgi:hypothetical protein